MGGGGGGGGGGGIVGLSGTEGGRARLTFFAEEGVFFKTSECSRFCIKMKTRGVFHKARIRVSWLTSHCCTDFRLLHGLLPP